MANSYAVLKDKYKKVVLQLESFRHLDSMLRNVIVSHIEKDEDNFKYFLYWYLTFCDDEDFKKYVKMKGY